MENNYPLYNRMTRLKIKNFYLQKIGLSIFILLFCSTIAVAQNSFITTWKTNNSGISNPTQITIPAVGEYSFYWELNDTPSVNGEGEASGAVTIDFPEEGVYKISILPKTNNPFNQIKFDFGGDSKKLLSIEQWGDVKWASFNNAYTETVNLKINAVDAPDLEYVEDMSFAFFDSGIGNEGNLNAWDVSSVVNMEAVFFGTPNFNQILSDWNMENVTLTRGMFAGTKIFNQPIELWDVSNVENMSFMFQDAQAFDQSLNEWNVFNVKDMSYMFSNTMVFNGAINEWNVENVENMEGMFTLAYGFNQPLNSWNVESVINLSTMFSGAILFNQPLDEWNVSSVETFWGMFAGSAFNQNIGDWSFPNAINMTSMLNEAAMDCENYSRTLIGWAENQSLPANITFGAEGLTFGLDAVEAREYLVDSLNWTILGDQSGTCSLGVDSNQPSQISIYPIPSNGIIHINSAQNIDKLTVFDISGRLVKSENNISNRTIQLDLSDFPAGQYFIHLTIGNIQNSHKIILQ